MSTTFQLRFDFTPPRTPYERWHADGFAGTWLDFLDFISWVPGEIPQWPPPDRRVG
jgi:hypothetical protein